MKQTKTLTILAWSLTIAPGTLFIASAISKFVQPKEVVEGFAKSGYPAPTLMPIGIAELVSALLFIFPKTRVLGAILLTGYMGGAIATHVRMGEIFAIQAVLGIIVWLALYLGDPRIRALLPFSQSERPETT